MIEATQELNLIYRKAVNFVNEQIANLLERANQKEPPYSPEKLAPLCGVRKIIRTDLGNISGMTIAEKSGFVIKLNKNQTEERQRFSLAHELVHTFFYSEEGTSILRELRWPTTMVRTSKYEEKWCDTGASDILMPRHVFKRYASRYGYSVGSIETLATTFKVSIKATAIRLQQVTPETCRVIFWKPAITLFHNAEKFSSSFAFGSKYRLTEEPKFFQFPKLALGKGSWVWKAYWSNEEINTVQRLPFGKRLVHCRIQAMGFGYGQYRFVASFIFPDFQE